MDSEWKKPSTVNIYEYDAQLASAFQADCEELFKKFSKSKDYSFANFTEIYKEMCFTAVFEGQDYVLMLQTFLENCFIVVKKFLFSNDNYVQTGAIYLLYALYYKQPFRGWIKVRLTSSEAKQMNTIIDRHKTNNCLQPVFVYGKMKVDGAFNFCALAQAQTLDANALKRVDLSKEQIHQKVNADSPLNKFKAMMNEDSSLKQLEEIDDEYQKLVTKYKKKCDKLFIFPANSVCEELHKAYADLFNDVVPSERGVRERAVANKNAVYRADWAVLTAMDLETTSGSK